jgi:hypothetical protein
MKLLKSVTRKQAEGFVSAALSKMFCDVPLGKLEPVYPNQIVDAVTAEAVGKFFDDEHKKVLRGQYKGYEEMIQLSDGLTTVEFLEKCLDSCVVLCNNVEAQKREEDRKAGTHLTKERVLEFAEELHTNYENDPKILGHVIGETPSAFIAQTELGAVHTIVENIFAQYFARSKEDIWEIGVENKDIFPSLKDSQGQTWLTFATEYLNVAIDILTQREI